MAWAVGQDVGNPLRKLVLMVLADEHRDDTDLCCPGLERIAAIGEMSTKSAARHIDALAELGKITVYKRGRSHGYILHCPPKADAVSNEAPPSLPTSMRHLHPLELLWGGGDENRWSQRENRWH